MEGKENRSEARKKALKELLEGLGIPCRETREPTGGPVGSLTRQIFTGRVTADNRVIAALYAADRIDHLVNEVDGLCAAIDSGITVVSDRYYFSSYAYHSVDVDMDWVIGANALSAQLLRPTATIFIDVSPELALERIAQNRERAELFETRDRLTRTREQYFKAFQLEKDRERVIIIPGDRAAEAVAGEIWAAVSTLLSPGA